MFSSLQELSLVSFLAGVLRKKMTATKSFAIDDSNRDKKWVKSGGGANSTHQGLRVPFGFLLYFVSGAREN